MEGNPHGSRRPGGLRPRTVLTREHRAARSFRLYAFAAIALVATLVAQGCDSDSPSKDGTQSPGAVIQLTPAGSPADPGSPLPSGPIDPSSLTYASVTGPSDGYRIDIPVGWTLEDVVAPGGYARRYALIEDTPAAPAVRMAAITVRCQTNRTIDDMVHDDQLAVGGRKGQFDLAGATSITVDGIDGKVMNYSLSPGGTPVEARSVYLASSPCSWRLVLQAFSSGGRQRFSQVFDRVVQSFHALPAQPPN